MQIRVGYDLIYRCPQPTPDGRHSEYSLRPRVRLEDRTDTPMGGSMP
jgi:hypothetical protein